MAGLAKEFEQLGCWESATEEENIVIYGMDFEDEKVFIVFTDDMGETPVDAKASLVAACYSEDDCFLLGQRTGKLRCLATYVQRIQTRLVCIAACFGSL